MGDKLKNLAIDFRSRRFCMYSVDNDGKHPMPIGADGDILSATEAEKGTDRLLEYDEAVNYIAENPGKGIAYWTGQKFIYGISKTGKTKSVYNPQTQAWEPCNLAPTIEAIDAESLQKKNIPPLRFIVEGWLPEKSLGMLCAPPKYYKSFLCLQMALCIASGNEFLGKKSQQGQVLYLDLEATERRPKSRIQMILDGKKAPADLFISTKCELIGQGLKEELAQFKADHPRLVLVIIDMLSNVRPPATTKNQGYEKDRDDMNALEDIVNGLGISILVVHHTRKMKDETDVFNQISGTTGLLGTADFIYMIDKEKRKDADATIYITGRDLAPAELAATFDTSQMRWVYRGTADEYNESRERSDYEANSVVRTIKKLLASDDTWSGTIEELKQSSAYFGRPIHGDNTKVGKELRKLESPLFGYDGISIATKKNDNKRVVTISKAPEEIPFETDGEYINQ